MGSFDQLKSGKYLEIPRYLEYKFNEKFRDDLEKFWSEPLRVIWNILNPKQSRGTFQAWEGTLGWWCGSLMKKRAGDCEHMTWQLQPESNETRPVCKEKYLYIYLIVVHMRSIPIVLPPDLVVPVPRCPCHGAALVGSCWWRWRRRRSPRRDKTWYKTWQWRT